MLVKKTKPSPAQTVERCETGKFLRKSFTNFTWDVCPGASGPYVAPMAPISSYDLLKDPYWPLNESLIAPNRP